MTSSQRHSQADRKPEPEWTIPQAFLATFAAIYFAAAVLWSFPVEGRAWNGLKEDFARPVLKPLGAYQNWSMFAPDPIRINRTVEARVTWKDGSTDTVPLPSALHGSFIDRVRGEQFRKWSVDNIRIDRNRPHWQGAAGWFARDALKQRAATAASLLKVELIRRWSDEISPEKPETWRGELNHEFIFYRLEGRLLAEELSR